MKFKEFVLGPQGLTRLLPIMFFGIFVWTAGALARTFWEEAIIPMWIGFAIAFFAFVGLLAWNIMLPRQASNRHHRIK